MTDLPISDELQTAPDLYAEVPCERVIGIAGTGKSYSMRKRAEADPSDILLTSTTGISAINLGCVTLNSTLKYFNTESLRDIYVRGILVRRLHEIAQSYRHLGIEEYSMLGAEALDILYLATKEANLYHDLDHPLGLVLCGDLGQLPPVNERYCFDADCWKHFAANTTRLTHVYRQSDGPFLDALNLVRSGDGAGAAEILTSAGAAWHTMTDPEFTGSTILPTNAQVNRHNALALRKLNGAMFTVPSKRWGEQRSEWGENRRTHEWGIPPMLDLKVGAYVMLLSNNTDLGYANGDCGHIVGVHPATRMVDVQLVRSTEMVTITPIVRSVEHSREPLGWDDDSPEISAGDMVDWLPQPHYRKRTRKYVTGQIEFLPVRLAYATTVHKAQGLTLDNVQVDFRDQFFGTPSMLYVAMSRARSLSGLRLVGMRERFIMQCKTDPRVIPWI